MSLANEVSHLHCQEVKEKKHLVELCQDMLNKSVGYFNGELTSTCEEYQLIERMNYESTKKFLEMKDVSVGICSSIENLNVKYANLQPYFEMIDQLEESVTSLEQAIYKVDSYSKRLEAKLKQLEKN